MDNMMRAISADGYVRGFAAVTTELVQDLQRRHTTFPVVSAALGRTATMAALLSLTIKDQRERITIQIDGDGPIGKITTETDIQSIVRGYIDHPDVMIPLKENGKLDVSTAVGNGSLYITRNLGLLGHSYQGTSPLISGELAEDFTYYFTASEQTPSSVGLGVLVNRDKILVAGGYLVQLLPDAPEEVIARLEANISRINSITEILSQGVESEQLLQQIIGDDVQILERKRPHFGCQCSRETVQTMLVSLGRQELQSIIAELGQAEVVCHFCNEKYQFDRTALQQIITSVSPVRLDDLTSSFDIATNISSRPQLNEMRLCRK